MRLKAYVVFDLFLMGLLTFLATMSFRSHSWVALVFEVGFGVLSARNVVRDWPWTERKDDEPSSESNDKTDELKSTRKEKL